MADPSSYVLETRQPIMPARFVHRRCTDHMPGRRLGLPNAELRHSDKPKRPEVTVFSDPNALEDHLTKVRRGTAPHPRSSQRRSFASPRLCRETTGKCAIIGLGECRNDGGVWCLSQRNQTGSVDSPAALRSPKPQVSCTLQQSSDADVLAQNATGIESRYVSCVRKANLEPELCTYFGSIR